MCVRRRLCVWVCVVCMLCAPGMSYASGHHLGRSLDEGDYYTSTTTTLVVVGVILLLVFSPAFTSSTLVEGKRQQDEMKKEKEAEDKILDEYRERSLRLYLRDRGELVEEALAVGAGPALDDLAAIMGVERSERRAWARALRADRAALRALVRAVPTREDAAGALRERLAASAGEAAPLRVVEVGAR